MDTITVLFQALETGLLQLCTERQISLHQYRQTLASLTIAEMTACGYLAYDAPLTHGLEHIAHAVQPPQHDGDYTVHTN
ncbi:MAG TPA: hypothetical protein DEF47_08635 [Herpetosiphon sp.]|uniref:hypothetical protein n=1 Tax=Herpetosiphon sp. TaxID=71864 RepID=UPI00030BA252|nr:hypothetical protein [Herpetosiphon sp.]HBW49959.1 hypothetical protein [Herpetosiphon sp.]